MNNYKLIIQYDGTNYAGWQIQKNAVTIQQKIIDAIEIITKEKVNLIGSGRTDSGVHAFGQVANFRTQTDHDLYRLKYSLNSVLPNDIAVTEMEKIDESFHSRFDARSRSYLYLLTHKKSPFYEKYSWHNPTIKKVDITILNELSKNLLGENDFTSFSRKNPDIEDKNCIISEIHWRRSEDKTIFYITANRFLHGMVRTIVGTLIYAAERNMNKEYLIDVLAANDRSKADESVPAKGLFLFKVRY